MKMIRWFAAMGTALLLSACFLTPGKFVSSLHIGKDRSFTFAYRGEVLLLDIERQMKLGAPEGDGEGEEKKPAAALGPEDAETLAKRRAIAEALEKEVGYRSVEYLGNDRFRVDYEMSGRLDRSFAYPLNVDALAIAPWIVVEVRKDGTARMQALAFGDPDSSIGGTDMGGDKDKSGREGTFTFTTDAALVMQNNEAGTAPGPGTRVIWKITPATKAVPTAVVKF